MDALTGLNPDLQQGITKFSDDFKKFNSKWARTVVAFETRRAETDGAGLEALSGKVEKQSTKIAELIRSGKALQKQVVLLIPNVVETSGRAADRLPSAEKTYRTVAEYLVQLRENTASQLSQLDRYEAQLTTFGRALKSEIAAYARSSQASLEVPTVKKMTSTMVFSSVEKMMEEASRHFRRQLKLIGVVEDLSDHSDSDEGASSSASSSSSSSAAPAAASASAPLCTRIGSHLGFLAAKKQEDYAVIEDAGAAEEATDEAAPVTGPSAAEVRTQARQAVRDIQAGFKEEIIGFKKELISLQTILTYLQASKVYFDVDYKSPEYDKASALLDKGLVTAAVAAEVTRGERSEVIAAHIANVKKQIVSLQEKIASAESLYVQVRHNTDVLLGEQGVFSTLGRGWRSTFGGTSSLISMPEEGATFPLFQGVPKLILEHSPDQAMRVLVSQIQGEEHTDSEDDSVGASSASSSASSVTSTDSVRRRRRRPKLDLSSRGGAGVPPVLPARPSPTGGASGSGSGTGYLDAVKRGAEKKSNG